MAGGTVHIAWYATGFRGDQLERALLDVSAIAMRYGATEWQLHRSRDDRYKLLQMVDFDDKADFERWWNGTVMTHYRVVTSGWWQVPALYVWHDRVGSGALGDNGNGTAQPVPEPEPADAVS
jgi:hypothetical protein